MAIQLTTRRCSLAAEEICPQANCPFWELDGSGLGSCAFAKLDADGDPDLAAWLLEIRRQLRSAEPTEEEGVLHCFRHLLNESAE